MKTHLNTLFVTTQGAYLATEGQTVVVRKDGESLLRLPFHLLEGIVCFGNVGCSPFLMGRCGERGIGISFLTERGRFLARVQGPVSGNVLLRRTQYRLADDEESSAEIARPMVIAKASNCRAVLQRARRDRKPAASSFDFGPAIEALRLNMEDLAETVPLNALRGVEGDAARSYFGVFDKLIVAQKDGFRFEGRSRRPPTDNVNSLISFLYTLLVHDVRSAVEAVGLDPQVGFLHRDRPGRPSLALDLMEELRPVIADRLALTLINRRQVKASGFVAGETGGVVMDDATRRAVLVAYQEKKREEITHPFLDEKTVVGMLPHLQALLLARHLRGDLDAYPPYLWR